MKMIEIGDFVNLYNGDLHNPNGNRDFMHQGMEQTDGSALHIHSTVSLQSSELNSLQEVQLHDGEISCMVDDRGVRNYTYRNGHIRQTQAAMNPVTNYNGIHELCEYSTLYSWNPEPYKRIHTEEKSHMCDLCDYSSICSGHLKTHKLIHSGERPYKCDLCNYSATQAGHLKRHKLIHTGEKPFKCDLCAFSTTQCGALKIHKLIHSGERPFKCDLCAYSTTAS